MGNKDYARWLLTVATFLVNNAMLSCDQVARIPLQTPGRDDERTLADIQFETGDYVDLTIVSVGEREVRRDRDFRGRGNGSGRGRF